MAKETGRSASEEIARIIESAKRLGVELDEGEALQWLAAMAAVREDNVVLDVDTGVYGHHVTLLDFSPQELERFREIGKLVGLESRENVQTALALSGSAAQSKIQTFPGDCDFFERVNIQAETREEACRVLAEVMRDKALKMEEGPTYRLIEVKFGSYPKEVTRGGKVRHAGSPIAWKAADLKQGQIEVTAAGGETEVITWEAVSQNPGWCKFDWVVADPTRGRLANASNMLDVTWEHPDGTITPLDGYLDPYFQEVYLDAESIPLFSRLAKHVSTNALDEYVVQLENEVEKYLTRERNYGKAAKRMYNIFRLTGRYYEAAFLRELFDEPATVLYQVWSLIRTLDDAVSGGGMTMDQVRAQADQLILDVIRALEGEAEQEIVRFLLRFRDALNEQEDAAELSTHAEAARAEVINIVNNFFQERLAALPEIKTYMDGFPRIVQESQA
jgi:hypothetical protein